mgnify:FL=1
MQFSPTDAEKKRARWAHDLFVLNILFFHLLLTPATIVMGVGQIGLLLPLTLSGLVIAFIYYRSRKDPSWFVEAHWRLSFNRCKLLMMGYAGSLLVFGIGWRITLGMDQESMRNIMFTVFTRIAIMPTLILAMVSTVLEASATSLVSKGEVPDKLVKAFPPPAAVN